MRYGFSKSGVPPNSVLFGGTVPPNSVLFGGTVPPNSFPLLRFVQVCPRCLSPNQGFEQRGTLNH